MSRAHAVARTQQEAGDRAASRIRALSDAPYHEPGLLSRMVDSVGDWVDSHAGLLREISNVLKTVSAIAGLLSFIPALTPIFGPIAALTAGGALVIDAALVATGHGDWKVLAVDAAPMALPGAGRLASRAMMARHGTRLTRAYADEVSSLGKQGLAAMGRIERPSTGSVLVTRNFGKNTFEGLSGGPQRALHPRLHGLLDNAPQILKDLNPSHGRCAEIHSLDDALKSGGRVRDGFMDAAHVRSMTNPKHGVPHPPCESCQYVMRKLGERWRL